MRLSLAAGAALALLGNYAAQACEPDVSFDLHIKYGWAAPDGGVTRLLVAANDTIPGPELRVELGQCVSVTFHNELHGEPVSVHYHGLPQRGTPWEDGTAMISECPLQPGGEQTHTFKPDIPGTFFYHAHIADQMVDGLYGAFIVEDPASYSVAADSMCFPPGGKLCVPADEYQEATVVLSDWWTQDSRTQSAGLGSQKFVWIGDPQAILINGKSANTTTAPQNTTSISLLRDSTYRVRVICATSLSYLRWGIEGHPLTIVAVDGIYVAPAAADYIDCSNGQRYDVLVNTDKPAAEGGAYWMYAATRYRTATVSGGARVLYDDAASAIPATPFTKLVAAVPPSAGADAKTAAAAAIAFEKSLQSTEPVPAGAPAVNLNVVLSQQRMSYDGLTTFTPYDAKTMTFTNLPGNDTGYLKWALNDVSFHSPSTPILLAAATGLYGDDVVTNPPHPLVVTLTGEDVVQVVLQNGLTQGLGSDQHPFHLHGHSFHVVGSGVGTYDPAVDDANFDLGTPLYRDTVTVFPYSWTAIRFVSDNPGAWPFHCHIGSHFSVMGMAMVFLERPDEIPPPPADTAVCGAIAANFAAPDGLSLDFKDGF